MSKNFILDDGQQFILVDPLASEQFSFGASNLNTYIKVSINLLNVKDGTTKTIYLINREYDSNIDAFPLLMDVDSLGLKLGAVLPDVTRGSITISNMYSSFGSERRFSDLLNRYTIVEREVKVWVAQIPLGKTNIQENDFNLIWKGIGTGIDFDQTRCRLSIASADIPIRVMTYVVNSDEFPDAPSSSLGKHLPIILSDSDQTVEVDALRVGQIEENATNNQLEYVYATVLGTKHLVDRIPSGSSGTSHILMENRSREWQRMNLLNWNSFFLGEDGTLFNDDAHSYSYNGTWAPYLREVGYKFTPGQNIEAGQVLVGVDWFLSTSITGDFYNFQPAKLICKVYSEWNNYPDELIAQDTIDCEVDYATRLELQDNIGSATHIYKCKFYLNKAIIVPENSSIFIVIARNDVSDTWPNGVFNPVHQDADSSNVALPSFEQYYKLDPNGYTALQRSVFEAERDAIIALFNASGISTTERDNYINTINAELEEVDAVAQTMGEWELQVISGGKYHLHTYGLAILSTSASPTAYQNGLGYKGFTFIMRPQEATPDLTQLRLIANVTGLEDGPEGVITGVANGPLAYPLHQIRALMRHWNGSDWVDKQFDHNKFSDTHAEHMTGRWGIRTTGATQGRTFLKELLQKLCQESMTRLIPYVSETDYSIGLFCYGTKRDRVAILDDENAKFISATYGGTENIINTMQIVYNRTVRSRTEEILAEGGYKQYNAMLDTDVTSVDAGVDNITISKRNYGLRPLLTTTRDFIRDESSAIASCALFLRRYLDAEKMVRIAVPYSQCPDLEGMDIVDIRFANLPAYYGSAQDAKYPMAGTEAVDVDLINGHYWKRLQKYRCAVIGNELILRRGEPLQHILTLLITNKDMLL